MSQRLLHWLYMGLCIWIGLATGEVWAQQQQPYTLRGRVVSVADGDTVGIRAQGQYHILRLHGVDTPEKRQLDGPAATAFTLKFCLHKMAVVKVVDRDRYGRLVADVRIGGKSLSEALLAAGWAWHYKRYSKSRVYAALERQARKARRGIWQRSSPTAPWDWRRRQYRRQGKRRYRGNNRRWRGQRRGLRNGRRNGRRYRRRYQNQISPPSSLPKSKSQDPQYHGNTVSRVFHYPGCMHYHCYNCMAFFYTPAEAIKAGYHPHKECQKNLR